MLADYQVNRCSRRCHHQSRPLRDGEWYFSVVTEQGDDLIRRDYSAESWTGPPDGVIGWWKGRMPVAGARKWVLAPDPVLVDLLRGMGESSARQPLRYLLALMLLRRRVVVPVPPTTTTENNATASQVDRHLTPLLLRVQSDGTEIEVMPCGITASQTQSLETALQELLYCEASE